MVVPRFEPGPWKRCIAATSVLLVTLTAGVVHAESAAAEPTPAQIRDAAEAFDRGREAYKAEKYLLAAEQFERADAAAPSATALELAIRSRTTAGDADRAATLSALSLERHPDDEKLTELSQKTIDASKADLFELTVRCNEPCELTDGNKIVHGRPALQRRVFLSPGEHELRAGFSEGRTESKSVSATAAGTGELTFEAPPQQPDVAAPEPVLAPAAPPEADRGPKKSGGLPPIVFWVGASVTTAVGGATIWSGLDTVNDPGAERVKAECAPGDEECPLYQEGRKKQLRTNILIGATGLLGVATALVGALATDWDGGKVAASKPGRAQFEAFVDWKDGINAGARGRF
jgi:hypothetical protein